MMSMLLGIIAEPPSARSTHEQNLFNWLQSSVHQNEIAMYTQALNQYHTWQNDPCDYTLDATVASQYGLSYDGAPFCYTTPGGLLNFPPVPAPSYYLAYGMEHSYGKASYTYPEFGWLVAGTSVDTAEAWGIGASTAGIVALTTGLLLYASIASMAAAGFSYAASSLSFIASTATVSSIGSAALTAGPAAVVLIAILIAVEAGIQAFTNQAYIDAMNNMSNTLSQVTNNPPDLYAFATDASGQGMYKLQSTFVEQTEPEFSSTAALPTHQATDLDFSIAAGSSGTHAYTDSQLSGLGRAQLVRSNRGWMVRTDLQQRKIVRAVGQHQCGHSIRGLVGQ